MVKKITKSLNQLKKERNKLLKVASTAQSKAKLKQSDAMERMRLEKEIKALRNPGSTHAKKAFFDFTKKATRSTGRFLKERARIINENLDRKAREDEFRMKKQRGKQSGKGKGK